MSDPRIQTVAAVLTAEAATNGPDDTDNVATKIVNALDREHGAPASDTDAGASSGEASAAGEAAGGGGGANPETPVGTGAEGGAPGATQ